VRRPTIVGFLSTVTQAELDQDADTNETLADFPALRNQGSQTAPRSGPVDSTSSMPGSFQIRIGTRITTFRPDDGQEGYYFIAPGKKPRIEYGVATDADILEMPGSTLASRSRIPPSMRAGSVTTPTPGAARHPPRFPDADRQQRQPDDGYSTSATSASGQQKNSRTSHS